MANKERSQLIFSTITGSKAYGTDVETSDTDRKGVYIAHPMEHVLHRVRDQIDISKDHVIYELSRFMHLAQKGNPTVLEMLFTPPEMWDTLDIWDDQVSRLFSTIWGQEVYPYCHGFLTKACRDSFGGYAAQQIGKAQGLQKKMNWEKSRMERKDVMDFCHVAENGKSVALKRWLAERDMVPEFCGLVALDKMPGVYTLYYDYVGHHAETTKARLPVLGYRGIVAEDGNDVRLSSVPKDAPQHVAVMTFNKDAYSQHCKDYREYTHWLATRNESRYVDTQVHGQQIDGKNLMHCRRLLDMGMEIAKTGDLTVRRPNRDELLMIRRGEVDLQHVVSQAKADLKELDELFASSDLPDHVDPALVEQIIRRCHISAQDMRVY